jgi:predicted dehydrogenase
MASIQTEQVYHVEQATYQKQVAVVGAGSQKGQDYITALLERPADAKIVAVVVNQNLPQKVQEWANLYGWKIIRDGNIKELCETVAFDTAIVSLPHDQHHSVTQKLQNAGISIIKEKPLAIELTDAQAYEKSIKEKNGIPIFTTVQRSTHPLFVEAKQDLSEIGKIVSFTYVYAFNLPSQTSGWRADPVKSGGGVVLDMGYHAIDVLNSFFGIPDHVDAQFGYKYEGMEKNRLEDSANVTLKYAGFDGKLVLDRHATKREESFSIVGERGTITLTPTTYDLFVDGEHVKQKICTLSKIEIIHKMFDTCLKEQEDASYLQKQFDRNVGTMRLINSIYLQKNSSAIVPRL